jgi:enediyne biosynthesis protein E4
MFDFPPQFGRLDGSYGHVLLNEGGGRYRWINPKHSGLSVKGAVKDIAEIQGKQGRQLLIVQNNEKPLIYKVK